MITIDWRIPQDNQRVMLFERLEYVVDFYANQNRMKRELESKSEVFKKSDTPNMDKTEEDRIAETQV